MTTYADLISKKVNGNTTIFNTKTGQGYSNPQALASDLGISPSAIQWGNIRVDENWSPQSSTAINPANITWSQPTTPVAPQPTTINQPTPAPASPITTPQTDTVFMENALQMLYSNRPDLQALYKPNGEAKDPTDPRIAGIPTLQAWAQKYGYNEDPTLAGYGPGAGAGAGTGGSTADSNFTTGVPELDQLYARLSQYVEDLIASNQKINPNIELTPETIKQFVDQATAEIEPYYANQIKLVREDLDNSIADLQKKYEYEKAQSEATFKQNLAGTRENLAGAGLAFSGVRGGQEQTAQQAQQRTLDFSAEAAASAARSAALGTEAKIGSRNLSDLTTSGFSNSTVSLEGQGGYTPGQSLSFYSPTGRDVTGSLEYSQRGDIRSLSDFLKQQEIQRRTLSFT